MTSKEYRELRERIGNRGLVARLLGVTKEAIRLRETDQRALRAEHVLALERILEKRTDRAEMAASIYEKRGVRAL